LTAKLIALTLSVLEIIIMLMQTGWIKSSRQVTLLLAKDPTSLTLRQGFSIAVDT